MGNREDLLEAAVTCLRERGYGGTRARELASTAGVSLGAIRYHFGSMEGLLNEAIAEISRRWIAGFEQSLSRAAPAGSTDVVQAATEALYEIFEANRLILVGFTEAFAHAQRSAAARAQLAGYYEDFRRLTATGIAAGLGYVPTESDALASLVIAVIDGLMVQWLLDPTRRLGADALRNAVAGLVSALATNPAAPVR